MQQRCNNVQDLRLVNSAAEITTVQYVLLCNVLYCGEFCVLVYRLPEDDLPKHVAVHKVLCCCACQLCNCWFINEKCHNTRNEEPYNQVSMFGFVAVSDAPFSRLPQNDIECLIVMSTDSCRSVDCSECYRGAWLRLNNQGQRQLRTGGIFNF